MNHSPRSFLPYISAVIASLALIISFLMARHNISVDTTQQLRDTIKALSEQKDTCEREKTLYYRENVQLMHRLMNLPPPQAPRTQEPLELR